MDDLSGLEHLKTLLGDNYGIAETAIPLHNTKGINNE